MRAHWIALVLAATSLVACSSASSAPPATHETTGSPCTTLDQCNWDRCVCIDGTATDFPGVCLSGLCATGGAAACMNQCAMHGGFASIAARPTVIGSPECNAFCSKIESCPNANCYAYGHCGVDTEQTEACVRANLACLVNRETFMCVPGGSGNWSLSGDCAAEASMCGADGG